MLIKSMKTDKFEQDIAENKNIVMNVKRNIETFNLQLKDIYMLERKTKTHLPKQNLENICRQTNKKNPRTQDHALIQEPTTNTDLLQIDIFE